MATNKQPNTTGNRNENTERDQQTPDAARTQGGAQQTGRPDERQNKPQAGRTDQARNQGGYGQERPTASNTGSRQTGAGADQGDLNDESTSADRDRSTEENDRNTSGRNDR